MKKTTYFGLSQSVKKRQKNNFQGPPSRGVGQALTGNKKGVRSKWRPPSLLLLLLLLAGAASSAAPSPLRFWLDTYAFGSGETDLLQEAIAASGGAANVSGVTPARFLLLKGYQQTRKWDVYWTNAAVRLGACCAATQSVAAPHPEEPERQHRLRPPPLLSPAPQACRAAYKRPLRPGQLVNCVPGSEAISEKAGLFRTLEAAYGRGGAAALAPLTFVLPRQHFQLAALLRQVGGRCVWLPIAADAGRSRCSLRSAPAVGSWCCCCRRPRCRAE